MNWLRRHLGLVLILTTFLVLGISYLRVTPLLETPDEPSHFSVVKYIADEARLPSQQPAPANPGPVPVITPGPPVYYAPPLYYVLGAFLIADLDTDGFAQGVIPNPNWARGWAPTPGRSPENKHIYVHTAAQRPPYAEWAAAMFRLRIFSLLLGGATVVGVYALARTIWSQRGVVTGRVADQSWILAATALAAFNPAFVFVTTGVSNDALLFALSTWSFVLMVRLVSSGGSINWRLVALLGLLMGLAALAKQSALAFLPVAALAVIWGAHIHTGTRRTVLAWLLLWAVLVALVAGWWYLHNALTYGDPLGFQPHRPPTDQWEPPLSLLARQLGQALRGYWGVFGWGLILVEPVIYVTIALLVLAGLLGLLAYRFSDRLPGGADGEFQVPDPQVRGAAVLALGLLLNLIGLVLWLWRTSAPYGRLLFPALGPLAVLSVMGWQRWLGQGRGRLFAWAVALALAVYAFIVPWRYLRPAYASPIVSDSAEQEAIPLDVAFDENLHLLGYRMDPASARPGDQVALSLYWQATARLQSDLTIFVQVAPQDPEKRVAGQDDYLGGSRYPSRVWQPGEVIHQVHQLRLPADAPAPVVYWYNVGLYADSVDERLPVTADGSPVPDRAVRLGPLRVLSRDHQEPRQRVHYRLGSAIQLNGYDIQLLGDFDGSASQGLDPESASSLTVTLYWQALDAPQGDWTVFVHLLDPDGRLVTQHDSLPRQGAYPTWAWRSGDRVPDPHTFALPQDLLPGPYSLRIGLYRPADDTRMPVFDQEGQRVQDDVVVLRDIDLSSESK